MSKQYFDSLGLPSVLLPISLSVVLPMGDGMVISRICFCNLEFSDRI